MELNKSVYLQEVLDSHKMSHIQQLVDKHKNRKEQIRIALEEKYKDKSYNCFNSGSFGKHTAINIKFDLDIVDPFKKDSFDTLEEMFDDVYDFLKERFGDEATIRKQKVSIGIIFNPDKDNDTIEIDVVPGRELSQGDYKESRDLNLYFNDDHWGIKKGGYTKTNIQAQIEHIAKRNDERKIIRLLKIWKHTNNENYKSFLFELITIKALDKSNITGNLWEKLKAVIEYIRDNVNKIGFSLTDPGNSNNDIIDTLTSWERNELSNTMSKMINNIEYNDQYIKSYFPLNDEYSETDSNEDGYGVKENNPASTPSNIVRFG